MVAARTLILLLVAAAALIGGPALAADCVLIDDFSRGTVGEFPLDWKPRKEEGRPVYSIREEDGRRFLHAASRGIGIQAGREVAWDLDTYPILAWSWRAVEFPKGSDERKSPEVMCATFVRDSVAQVPIECGCCLAYCFTELGARRSELPSRSTGLTALPSTFEYRARIAFSSSVFGASG